MGLPRFELGSPAPQAGRIPDYPTAPLTFYAREGIRTLEGLRTQEPRSCPFGHLGTPA